MARIASGGGTGTTPSTVVDVEEREYTLPQFETPNVPNAPAQTASPGFVRRVVEDPVITQGQSAYMDLFGTPYNPYVGPGSPWDERGDALAVAQSRYLAEPEIETVAGAGTQYTGREFYQGGSEQAYLGPIWQAQAAFGLLTPKEMGFLGVNGALPSHLNPAQERILLDNGVPQDVLDALYDFDPDTGFWFRTSYDDLGDAATGGYDSYTSAGGGRYGYPSYGGTAGGGGGGGLLNWRIGF